MSRTVFCQSDLVLSATSLLTGMCLLLRLLDWVRCRRVTASVVPPQGMQSPVLAMKWQTCVKPAQRTPRPLRWA